MERTFCLIKPDGVQRQLIGEIISRFERKGLKVAAMKLIRVSDAQARKHYGVHRDKPFFGELISFITSGPVVAMVLEGRDAVRLTRAVMGATRPEEATPGSIRGDFALYTGMNLVHGSDSPDTAREEIANFFDTNEILDFPLELSRWITG